MWIQRSAQGSLEQSIWLHATAGAILIEGTSGTFLKMGKELGRYFLVLVINDVLQKCHCMYLLFIEYGENIETSL